MSRHDLAVAAIRRIHAERRMPYWLRWLLIGALLGSTVAAVGLQTLPV